VSKLRGHLKTPHFCDFYGAYRAVSDIHFYNLEDEIEDFRFTRWFWEDLEKGVFGLRIIEKATGRRLTIEEIKESLKPDDEYLSDDIDSEEYGSVSETDSLGAVSLTDGVDVSSEMNQTGMRLGELEAAVIPLDETETDAGEVANAEDAKKDDDVASLVSLSEEYTIHAELYNMPVAVMYLEEFEATIDDFLEKKLHAPIRSAEEEAQWTAWLFQICAACSQLQNTLRLTHNDLHTANILWRKTTEQFLYYKDSAGRHWKVPTHGYIFSIIDYGRAIFYLNNYCIISSDYNDGHDAAGMYNFGPIEDPGYPRILPNKSFDLSRLACSLLRGLFPVNPEGVATGKVITKEGEWEVKESAHPVFNMLWNWLKTKKGESVLETETGEEKYPGFDLYEHIASEVGDAIPEQQFNRPWFQPFLLKGKEADAAKPGNWIQIPL
jgi:hypothetical protein